ncbi:unnamed protein product [Caenorhabditis brenneri]
MGMQAPPECDSSSFQVIIKDLNSLKEELYHLEQEAQEHDSVVFRQSATQYNQLCAEMRSFLDVAKSSIVDAKNSEEETNDKVTIIRLARINSFAMSTENFRISILRKFVSFVDVSMPFVAELLLVEIAFNEIALRWKQEAKRMQANTASAFPRFLLTRANTSRLISNEKNKNLVKGRQMIVEKCGGIEEGGTAKDAKVVTEEMEETGQIDGLEDEQPVDLEEHEAKNDDEKPIGIEEDFAEDLQDVDKNEKGDQYDGEDQYEE